MLRTLKDLFELVLSPPPGPARAAAPDAHRVRLAAAVLLVEVMRADAGSSDAEVAAATAALQRVFELPADEIAPLLALAARSQREATDFHAFTSALNERLSPAEKLAVVEAMWQVAFADGELAAHERHILWRVADLLHVQHGDYIGAKTRAMAASGAI